MLIASEDAGRRIKMEKAAVAILLASRSTRPTIAAATTPIAELTPVEGDKCEVVGTES